MEQSKGKYAFTVTVGEKGQFVIPKKARDIFNIQPGDTLILLADEKQGLAIPPKAMFDEVAGKVFGTVPPNEKDEV